MTALRLLPPDAPEDEWLAARRKGVTASEIAAVMGVSPYDSPFSLWWRKRNGWDADVNDEMRIGKFLEPIIADWFEDFGDPLDNVTIELAGLYAHMDRPFQMATPDRLIYADVNCPECGGWGFIQFDDHEGEPTREDCIECDDGAIPKIVAVLECKWVAASWDGWGPDGSSDIPLHYWHQVQWQMDVLDVTEAFVCALGPGGFRVFRIRRDDKALVGMREMACRFLDSLERDEYPDVDDHAATMPILRRLNPDIEDREQEIPADIAEGYRRAKRYASLAKRCEARYSALVRHHLGNAKTAVLAGEAFASRTTDDKLRSLL